MTSDPGSERRQRRVLIVDDSSVAARQLEEMIADLPEFEVVGRARHGGEAIQMFRRLHPEVICMDLVMPVMDGLEATRWILRMDADVRIVAVSSLGSSHRRMEEMVAAGASAVLSKPFDREQVRMVLGKFGRQLQVHDSGAPSRPPDDPTRNLPEVYFRLTRSMLAQIWGIFATPGPVEHPRGSLERTGIDVSIELSGDVSAQCVLGVTPEVAGRGARQMLRAIGVTDEDRQDVVRELANVVCGRLAGELSYRWNDIALGTPKMHGGTFELGARRATCCTFQTPYGTVRATFVD